MSAAVQQIARRRTFAIISHPDAGKTTLTEKLLWFGGAIQVAGEIRARKAARHGDEVVGIGGIKAADWASDTHILYLSAVTEHARGQGIARALIAARIAWAMENFTAGRMLVSTARPRRFARLGFRLMGKREAAGRRLMLLEF